MEMKYRVTFSGFADEIDPSLDEQLRVLRDLYIPQMEIRGADGKNITEYTLEETKEIARRLEEAEIGVSAVGSPLGKIKITDDFEPHMELFRHVVEQAKILGTHYIRMFSFYIPEGEDPAQYREEVFRRLRCFIECARENDIVLLHENEKGIYGDNAARCLDLFRELFGAHFRCTFDFANFVQCKQDTQEAFEMLKPYIDYVHVKDAQWEDGKVVPAGQGDGHLLEIFSQLDQRGYAGVLSLEPHLVDFAGLDALENGHKEEKEAASKGEAAFRLAFASMKEILEKEVVG